MTRDAVSIRQLRRTSAICNIGRPLPEVITLAKGNVIPGSNPEAAKRYPIISRPSSPRVGSSPLNGLGGGFGFKLKNYKADYTFTPFGDLGNAQRISLGAAF